MYETPQPKDNRFEQLIEKIFAIDSKYKPSLPETLNKDSLDQFKKEYREWKKNLRTISTSTKKELKKTVQLSSYGTYLSKLRSKIKQSTEANPMHNIVAQQLLSNSNIDKHTKSTISAIAEETDPQAIDLNLAELVYNDLKSISDKSYTEIINLRKYTFHPIIDMLKPSKRETEIIDQQKKKAFSNSHKPSGVIKIRINHYLVWMENVLKNIAEHDYIDLTLALALATGRRPVEILKTAQFSNPRLDTLTFTGQVKTKLYDRPPIRIPTLAPASECCAALEKIRAVKDFSNISNDVVNNRTSSTLNRRLGEIIGDEHIVLRNFRTAYGKIALDRFYNPEKHGSTEYYIAEKLGHADDDFDTVQHYKSVIFIKSETRAKADKYWEAVYNEVQQTYDDYAAFCADKLEHLKQFDGQFSRAKGRIYDFCIAELKDGNYQLSQTYLYKTGGFSLPAVKQFLAIVGELRKAD